MDAAIWADVPALAAISFSRAVRALKAACVPDLGEALFGLKRVKCAVEAMRIVRYYDPDDPQLGQVKWSELAKLFESPAQYLPIEERALEIVGGLFPINYTMEEQMLNLDGNDFACYLYIEPQGTAWTFDDFDWLTSRPAEMFNKEQSALVWGKYLDAAVDVEAYQEAAAYFGWPERLPLSLERDIRHVNGEELISMLEERGLEEFAWVFQVVFQSVDNPFFDRSEEDVYTSAVEFTLENVQEVEEFWSEAQLVIDQVKMANELALNAPEVLERVLDAWDECTVFEEPQKRTLVEMFAGEDEPERVIDPFYGPLDGIEDWDEEAEDGEEEE